jgi:hypothetical protein
MNIKKIIVISALYITSSITIDCASRFTWVAVTPQRGADCGYHALYNGLAEYIRLTTGHPVPHMPAATLAAWRKHIVDRRAHLGKELGNGEWLDDGEVDYLKEKHLGDTPFPPALLPALHNNSLIIPDATNFNILAQPVDPLVDAVTKLRNQRGYSHVFIVGNMNHALNSQGHWVAVVATNNGPITYRGLDSIGGNPPAYVTAVANLVEHGNINEWKFAHAFDEKRGDAERALNQAVPDHAQALDIAQALINNAVATHIVATPLFLERKPTLMALLHRIEQEAGVFGNNAAAVRAQALHNQLAKIVPPAVAPKGVAPAVKKAAAIKKIAPGKVPARPAPAKRAPVRKPVPPKKVPVKPVAKKPVPKVVARPAKVPAKPAPRPAKIVARPAPRPAAIPRKPAPHPAKPAPRKPVARPVRAPAKPVRIAPKPAPRPVVKPPLKKAPARPASRPKPKAAAKPVIRPKPVKAPAKPRVVVRPSKAAQAAAARKKAEADRKAAALKKAHDMRQQS